MDANRLLAIARLARDTASTTSTLESVIRLNKILKKKEYLETDTDTHLPALSLLPNFVH